MRRGEIAKRGWLVAFFALLAAACIAAPVLAETPAEETETSDSLELQRDESLETPQAAAEREDSEFAYAGLSAGQEANLLQDLFAAQLEAIDADPARALAEVTIERLDSPTEALVTLDGEKALLESDVPLRAPEEDGDLHKVELGLEETAAGYEPANPLVDLTLPDTAQDPIVIGDEGLAITPVGTAASAATPIGEEDLLLPAAHEDTSLLLSPIAGGLELSALLASRNSPQELSFDVALPPGATLRASEAGGAEVVGAGGELIATVTAPHAVDAQGTEVPAALAVEGNALSILVPHQELDVAYPLFVDPEINESFYGGSNLGYWHWAWGGVPGAEDYIGRTSCIVTCWGPGLYVRARSSFAYPAGSWGRWWFTPQGSTTYMRRVILGPVSYDAHGCTANQPHGYIGVWNDYSGWVVRSNAFPSGWATSVDVGNLPPGSRTAFVGIHADSNSNLGCGRDYRLGGATLYLDDPENPSAGATSGYPTGWIKSGASFTINAPASDPGIGVSSATLSPGGSPPVEKKHGCTGYYSNPCPGNHTFQFPIGAASFDEGEKPVKFSVTDALGKPSNTYQWNLKVDRTPPEIELAGQLAQATDETEGDGKDDKDKPLPLPVYNLTVNATDGVLNPSEGGQKRSGVKRIQVFIDNRSTPEQTWEASSCSAGNCPLSNKVFTLKLNELSADTEHYLRVLATDFAGNAPRERKLEFEYIPATGMKDEYVMQYFPLPDGSGNESEEEHPSRPELAVNLVSGNLVYRQEDLDVSGAAADLELELFYNSLLPEQQDTEWGDGWTLSQTPELEIEEAGAPGPPSEATIVDESAMVESKVDLPQSVGEEEFDKRLQATVEKVDGGYALTDESGETGETVSFDASGKAEELTNGTAASVEYDYEEGDLSAITIEDPGTANADPESIEEEESPPGLDFLHSANFGAYGSENGQLKLPGDVAIDSDGNLWVLDVNNGRVQKFGPDGQFLAKWGTPGTAEGQLNNPSAIALDGEGNILVADSFRVQKFSPTGQLLSRFGSLGSGDGQFFAPTALAVAGDGSVWVSDFAKVQRFSASGQFIERIGASGAGQITLSESIAAGPGGEIFVADSSLDKVLVFDQEGDYLRQFGSSGTDPGQLAKPVEVSLDAEGQVWVADEQTDRIEVFSSAGDYIAGFGGPGTGAEQLDLRSKSGIAVALGRVWVADGGNHRISRWAHTRIDGFLHSANLGSFGSDSGQLKTPGDIAGDDQGNLWILDSGNGRVQKLGPDGQFLAKFGTPGTGDGQLNSPSALALDAAGNVLVAENNRVQKLGPGGEFLAKFGTVGGGDGQFIIPSGIAIGADGSIWVTDTSRIQRFTASGQFIERVGVSGAGQITWPESIAAGPSGEMFVVDPGLDRVLVYSQEGDYLRQFGSSGTGPGQLAKPVEVSVDAEGQVWIADEQTGRVQVFSADGTYIAGFGGSGSGTQQLDLRPKTGIAVALGRVWVADAGNHRIDEWVGGIYEPSEDPVLTEDDPQLEVNVSDGLVDSVEGEESGTIDYEHDGDLLTAVDAPDGEAQFSYDSAGRMTKVSLPTGTYAEVAYEATYGRVKSVTVAVEGKNPKTTHFSWSDEPHRTTVTPPDAPATTYDIAADGSIFKWWNAKQPPVFDDVAGTLFQNRETSTPISTGVHNLVIQAHDDEGVASIQVIANNNQLVDERTCTYDPEKPTECVTETNEWVTETANWPPGIVYLEVIATDRLGEASSQRFWVNIPYTPPPDPEAEEPPRFNDILRFREDRGLDLDLKGDEQAINDRVFESMGDWNNPLTPAGEVARATHGKWGVPLRAVDAAELEYRQAYADQAVSAIPTWASAHAGSFYAGYFIDERAGGLLRVGFTGGESSQSSQIEALKQGGGLMAPDRIRAFEFPPGHSLASLVDLQNQVNTKVRSFSPNLITKVSVDVQANRVMVGATDIGQADNLLDQAFGATAPITVSYRPPMPKRSGRERVAGPIRAGDWMRLEDNPDGPLPPALQEDGFGCTANFGAFDRFKSPQTGENIYVMFVLGAGHCLFEKGHQVMRRENPSGNAKDWIGWIRREGNDGIPGTADVDAAAVRLDDPGLVPRTIFRNEKLIRLPVNGIATGLEEGTEVCYSGITSNKERCGPIIDKPHTAFEELGGNGETTVVCFEQYIRGGDSGSPVWLPGANLAVGIANEGYDEEAGIKEACFDPLVPYPGWGPQAGVLTHPDMAPLQLAKAP